MAQRLSWTMKPGCPDVLLLRRLHTHTTPPTPAVTSAPASSTCPSDSAFLSVSTQKTLFSSSCSDSGCSSSYSCPLPPRPSHLFKSCTRISSSSSSGFSCSSPPPHSLALSRPPAKLPKLSCQSGSDSACSSSSRSLPPRSSHLLFKSRARISSSSSSASSCPPSHSFALSLPPAKVCKLSSDSSSLCARSLAIAPPPAQVPQLSFSLLPDSFALDVSVLPSEPRKAPAAPSEPLVLPPCAPCTNPLVSSAPFRAPATPATRPRPQEPVPLFPGPNPDWVKEMEDYLRDRTLEWKDWKRSDKPQRPIRKKHYYSF